MRLRRPPLEECPTNLLFFSAGIILLLLSFVFSFVLQPQPASGGLPVLLPRVLGEAVGDRAWDIVLTKEGLCYVDAQRVSLPELSEILLSKKDPRDFVVLIRADRRADIGALTQVWDSVRGSGISRVYIATDG